MDYLRNTTLCGLLVCVLITVVPISAQNIMGRELSGYDICGPFDLNFTPKSDDWEARTAEVREFLWDHWQKKRLARASIHYLSREGEPNNVEYFVEPDSSHEWHIVIEGIGHLHRRPSSEERIETVVVLVLERIRLRAAWLEPKIPIPKDQPVKPQFYELLFKDDNGKIVSVL